MAKQLDTFPTGREMTDFQYRGYDIYIEPCENHLLFYTVNENRSTVTVLRILQDGMDWQNIIKRWLRKNS